MAKLASGVLVSFGSFEMKTMTREQAVELQKTVLVVMANSGQLDALLNWRCHADAHGLKYLVIALDGQVASFFSTNAPTVPVYLGTGKAKRTPLES